MLSSTTDLLLGLQYSNERKVQSQNEASSSS